MRRSGALPRGGGARGPRVEVRGPGRRGAAVGPPWGCRGAAVGPPRARPAQASSPVSAGPGLGAGGRALGASLGNSASCPGSSGSVWGAGGRGPGAGPRPDRLEGPGCASAARSGGGGRQSARDTRGKAEVWSGAWKSETWIGALEGGLGEGLRGPPPPPPGLRVNRDTRGDTPELVRPPGARGWSPPCCPPHPARLAPGAGGAGPGLEGGLLQTQMASTTHTGPASTLASWFLATLNSSDSLSCCHSHPLPEP
ncbi:hypothetical protein VULLAG_LOCUS5465 [Vulpes lagopus]